MTCHTKQDRSTLPPRAIDQRRGVKKEFHEDMNYDGQGKSKQQEDVGSITAAAIVIGIIVSLIVAMVYLAAPLMEAP